MLCESEYRGHAGKSIKASMGPEKITASTPYPPPHKPQPVFNCTIDELTFTIHRIIARDDHYLTLYFTR